jgi:hypothetical protein
MLVKSNLRLIFFVSHGLVALAAGLAVLYLHGIVTNALFEAFAVVIALVLCGAAITLAGITDWFAALGVGSQSFPQMILYGVAGFAFVSAGLFLGFSTTASIQLLLVLVIAHGLVFGSVAVTAAGRMRPLRWDQVVVAAFGVASIIISGILASEMRSMEDRTALAWIGSYLCLVGVKLFFFAGEERYHALHARPASATLSKSAASTLDLERKNSSAHPSL